MNKVVLIGCGNVGMAYAYSIVTSKNKVDELVLIDVNKDRAQGEAMDLIHAAATSSNRIKIRSGDYDECDNASLIVIAAGRNQEIGETRNDLIRKNYEVFKSIISCVNKTAFKGIYLIATNPLDIMTYITYKLSGFKPNRVIGSGTVLDTSRLRCLISDEIHINTKNIHAYVIGEHGDSEFIPWSNAIIGLNKATEFLDENQRAKILYDVRNSAYDIINKKGNTAYGIGMCLLNITNAIFDDANSIMTVSSYDKHHNIYYGMPTIINRSGVVKTLSLTLDQREQDMLNASIESIKENVNKII